MSAIIRACTTASAFKNTGTGSNLFPSATAMVFVMSPKKKFTLADLNSPDIVSVFTEWIHASGDEKVYPLFGNQVPISGIANTKGTDNTVTLDDGQVIFVSYTQYNKLFSTTDGGLCFAKVLLSFNGAKMAVIEVDIKGNIVCKDNKDGTYSGLMASLFSPAIDMADLKNPAKSYFQLGYMPDYFVKNAAMLQDGTPLLDLTGLMDLTFLDAGGSTATSLKLKVIDNCCGDDVTAEYGTDLAASKDNFIVNESVTGAAIVPTAATYANGVISLTGTYASGKKYNVTGAAPDVLLEGNVEGVQIGTTTVPVNVALLEAPGSPPSEDDFEDIS